jgi:glutamate---cysteine ligase / carboxylate-amine ligase
MSAVVAMFWHVTRVRSGAPMHENFTSEGYSLGIEEELMICDGETLELANAIEQLLGETEDPGEIKPELMESVLEIATTPCASIAEAGEQLRTLRTQVCRRAKERNLAIGSAGTHPYAMWEDQRIVARPRYRDLIEALRFVARQELIFGMHVHVGIDDPDKAIHVANGMRVHVPVLLALSANSPFWRADATGLMSTRTPIFRTFPRVGIPPAYKDWEDYQRRISFMVDSGVMEDPTYLWYDVRPHPKFGTVEIRACDSQTRVEHTLGLAALAQAMVRELAEHFDAGTPLSDYPWEMLDENKWLAARHGLDGELVDLPTDRRVPTKELARRLLDRLREHAEDLGSLDAFEAIEDLLARGTGAHRQRVVYEANRDLREVMAEIVEATVPG